MHITALSIVIRNTTKQYQVCVWQAGNSWLSESNQLRETTKWVADVDRELKPRTAYRQCFAGWDKVQFRVPGRLINSVSSVVSQNASRAFLMGPREAMVGRESDQETYKEVSNATSGKQQHHSLEHSATADD